MGFGSLGKIASIANPAMALAAATTGNFADRQEQRHNAKQQYVYNSWLQSQNEEFQKYMAENAHQMEVDDLKKAGLNPILSAMGSSAGSIAGSSAPQGTTAGNAPSNYSQGLQNALATIQTNSTKDLNEQLGNKANAEANEARVRAGLMPKKIKSEISELDSRSAKNEAESRYYDSEANLYESKKDLNSAKTKFENERSRGKTTSVNISGEAGNKYLGKVGGTIGVSATR